MYVLIERISAIAMHLKAGRYGDIYYILLLLIFLTQHTVSMLQVIGRWFIDLDQLRCCKYEFFRGALKGVQRKVGVGYPAYF